MLLKLLKYDFRKIFNFSVPIYIVSIVLAVVNGLILIPISEDILQYEAIELIGIILVLFTNFSQLVIVVLNIIPVFFSIIYFYNHIFSREGYLTNTLPVTHHDILISKLISLFSVNILSLISMIFSIHIFNFHNMYIPSFEDIKYFLDYISFSTIFFSITAFITATTSYILIVFMSISLGHLTKHRVIMSFVAFWVIQNILLQPIGVMTFYIFTKNDVFEMIPAICTILFTITSAIGYFTSAYILKNRLNLQ